MKQCDFVGCKNPVFSSGKCKWHYKPVKPLRRRSGTITPKTKNNGRTGLKLTSKQELMVSFGFRSQKEMFDFIWKTRDHVCPISNFNLDLVPEWKKHWCCAHILNKKNYPLWKLNPENILLIHPDVHYCVDNFYEDMRKKYDYNFDIWFDLVNLMKQKYLEFSQENNI